MLRYAVTDFAWSVIAPIWPQKSRGVLRVDDRRVLNGIFWVLRCGAPWAVTFQGAMVLTLHATTGFGGGARLVSGTRYWPP